MCTSTVSPALADPATRIRVRLCSITTPSPTQILITREFDVPGLQGRMNTTKELAHGLSAPPRWRVRLGCNRAQRHTAALPHPEDALPADGVTFLSCDVTEAVRIALDAADGKNVEVFSPTIGRQLLQVGLIDEIDLHIVPVLLGDGVRLYDNPGGSAIHLDLVNGDDHRAVVNVRYHPVAASVEES